MIFRFLKGLFGTAQERRLVKYRAILTDICQREADLAAFSDDQVRSNTETMMARLKEGESRDQVLVEAYATLREACRRLKGSRFTVMGHQLTWDMVPFDEQLLGAIAMHFGEIAEMQTGEGKTLTACLPLYLNALGDQSAHLVTVNDYLAERDCQWNRLLFEWLGVSVAAITQATPHEMRGELYQSRIVYATASELGFDYLRDNSMAHAKREQVQRGFGFAIVDEVDSILIDEARTPLIISGPAPLSTHMYDELKERVARIVAHQRNHCDELAKSAWERLLALGATEIDLESRQRKFSKEQRQEWDRACRDLWLVNRGLPRHSLLRTALETPALRRELDQLDLQLYGELAKEERASLLADLFVLVDERNSEYELTDLGAAQWHAAEGENRQGGAGKVQALTDALIPRAPPSQEGDDFVMLDLGYEYSRIDQMELSEAQRMEQKLALQAEDGRRKERVHNVRQLLRAHLLMERDVDYIVQDQKIVIIDENTGRPQPGRRYADGLHQAIEAKERVPIQRETQTYASITLQNYFRMYRKLSGMSGTAITEDQEFREIYGLDVLQIPTHLPSRREDAQDAVYMTEREKYRALVADVEGIHRQGRPILIGTESVEASEKLSRIFRDHRLNHTVLNAKQHAQEAEVISRAGQRGAITISTNMAGRGTDIRLGPDVAALGGLHVIGATRHQSRRIDRQLRGRCARQGDPGSSKFYVSFEDQLIRLFASPKMTALLQRFRPPEGESISSALLSRSIETAQKRVEQRNYTIRKNTLEFDDVMNVQRREVYALRGDLIQGHSATELAEQLLHSTPAFVLEHYFPKPGQLTAEGLEAFCDWAMAHFPVSFEPRELAAQFQTPAQVQEHISEKIARAFAHKCAHETARIAEIGLGPEVLEEALRTMLLSRLDQMWQEHLLDMDHLRAEVHLRTLGQKDPLLEYKEQAFHLFAQLSAHLREKIAIDLFRFEIIAKPLDLPFATSDEVSQGKSH